jgi:hypothetical protein
MVDLRQNRCDSYFRRVLKLMRIIFLDGVLRENFNGRVFSYSTFDAVAMR